MLKFDHVETSGWEAAIRGARNPMNSWNKIDSKWELVIDDEGTSVCSQIQCDDTFKFKPMYMLGPNDYDLCKRLIKAGSDHRKFLRMIHVQFDVEAPLSFWKEADTYKVATVRNSCSTMHKIHAKQFELEDFSYQKLKPRAVECLKDTISELNYWRDKFNETKDKSDWEQMIELLPSSYNQRATLDMNYETLKNIYHARKNHKMTEWHTFCDMIRNLPYSEFITDEWNEISEGE
jgi:hypothetical protein